jgi:hypothetical protein
MSEKINEAVELLRSAEFNCDNVKVLGLPMIDFVKTQIKEAINLLDPDV